MFWWFLSALYLVMSLVALGAYAYDKHQAKRKRWRVSERTLHWIEGLGGWPGAFLAQRWLRHKLHKEKYMSVFRVLVIGHLALWGLLGFAAWSLALK
jgi:uncharacterized membrane protein YsdA (DUF1294 family)